MELIIKLEDVSNRALAIIASNMETENKHSPNRKVAAAAFLSFLKKYKPSAFDKSELGMGKQSSKTRSKRAVATRAKTAMAKANPYKKMDKRLNVAYKHKSTKGSDQWHAMNAPDLVKASRAKARSQSRDLQN